MYSKLIYSLEQNYVYSSNSLEHVVHIYKWPGTIYLCCESRLHFGNNSPGHFQHAYKWPGTLCLKFIYDLKQHYVYSCNSLEHVVHIHKWSGTISNILMV